MSHVNVSQLEYILVPSKHLFLLNVILYQPYKDTDLMKMEPAVLMV